MNSGPQPNISNDFGQVEYTNGEWLVNGGKELTETRVAIRVFGLTRFPEYIERRYAPRAFMLGYAKVRLVKDPILHDLYLELVKPWKGCTNTAINLVTTPCHYGGSRYWLVCPHCQKRAGVLYRGHSEFRCRRCLEIGYYSQKQNYRTIAPTIRRLARFEQMAFSIKYKSYRDQPTKRTLRQNKLRMQVQAGMDYFGPKYSEK